ncbi:uncharacterized protein L201_006892 [Kwoniella dendrophila CBS 6074]|uniref:Uncharacterized protein n=1 Tax=Kwoniella dendrophila CBS 6074 TaxID=1295534 RepID=A0AAX4K592_9TREE
MLISPSKIHSTLTSLLSTTTTSSNNNDQEGPHTALLIYPNGQLVSSATLPPTDDEDDGDEDVSKDDDEEDEEDDEEEEPYLEKQERIRLLLGLASQWNENESGKMECELGKLHFTYLPLNPISQASIIGKESLPTIKPQSVDGFILVLNSNKRVNWRVLIQKSEEFKSNWKSQ